MKICEASRSASKWHLVRRSEAVMALIRNVSSMHKSTATMWMKLTGSLCQEAQQPKAALKHALMPKPTKSSSKDRLCKKWKVLTLKENSIVSPYNQNCALQPLHPRARDPPWWVRRTKRAILMSKTRPSTPSLRAFYAISSAARPLNNQMTISITMNSDFHRFLKRATMPDSNLNWEFISKTIEIP